MHNTKGSVALMNISREKKDISMILCIIQNKVLRLQGPRSNFDIGGHR